MGAGGDGEIATRRGTTGGEIAKPPRTPSWGNPDSRRRYHGRKAHGGVTLCNPAPTPPTTRCPIFHGSPYTELRRGRASGGGVPNQRGIAHIAFEHKRAQQYDADGYPYPKHQCVCGWCGWGEGDGGGQQSTTIGNFPIYRRSNFVTICDNINGSCLAWQRRIPYSGKGCLLHVGAGSTRAPFMFDSPTPRNIGN